MAPTIIYRVYNQNGGLRGAQRWWKRQVLEDLKDTKEISVLGEEFALPTSNEQPNQEAAINLLLKYALPYCGAVAIPFTGKVSDKPAWVIRAEEDYAQASTRLQTVRTDLHESIVKAKSKTIGCKECGSQIARKYVKPDCDCPVCGFTLLAESYRKRLASAIKAVHKAESKLPKGEPEYNETTGTCYLIGGWKV